MKNEIMPSPEEMKRLEKQNKAHHERGLDELDKMKSIGEEEKEEVRDSIANKGKENYEKQQGIEKTQLVKDIEKRAYNASPKIMQKIQEVYLPRLLSYKAQDEDKIALERMEGDFYDLVENPNSKIGAEQFKGWTSNEIRELYSVLYGKEMKNVDY